MSDTNSTTEALPADRLGLAFIVAAEVALILAAGAAWFGAHSPAAVAAAVAAWVAVTVLATPATAEVSRRRAAPATEPEAIAWAPVLGGAE